MPGFVPGIHVFARICFPSVSSPFHRRFIAPVARNPFRDDDHILVVLEEPLSRLLDPNVYRTWNRQS
jgi:hypothetical protein